jgi:hypothetical protein
MVLVLILGDQVLPNLNFLIRMCYIYKRTDACIFQKTGTSITLLVFILLGDQVVPNFKNRQTQAVQFGGIFINLATTYYTNEADVYLSGQVWSSLLLLFSSYVIKYIQI